MKHNECEHCGNELQDKIIIDFDYFLELKYKENIANMGYYSALIAQENYRGTWRQEFERLLKEEGENFSDPLRMKIEEFEEYIKYKKG